MFDARLLGCEGDGNAGVGSAEGVVAVSANMGGTRGSGVLASAGDVLEMSVVRGVSGVCDMCMCLVRGGVGGMGMSGSQDCVSALHILKEHGVSGICVCVLVVVVWVVLGENEWVAWARVWQDGWCYVCVCCESALSVLMAGPGICILYNTVAPYRYHLPNLYTYVADIANPDLFACGSRTWISLL